ncbi:hypothetical protein [Paracoccus homiensis]|uniref:hypothetical protein n=1 Tax=Paracoccus homiensis TaxID=364199 RepID=UPI0011138B04|nr:hypothetical protein [Paracoccus homiensis]
MALVLARISAVSRFRRRRRSRKAGGCVFSTRSCVDLATEKGSPLGTTSAYVMGIHAIISAIVNALNCLDLEIWQINAVHDGFIECHKKFRSPSSQFHFSALPPTLRQNTFGHKIATSCFRCTGFEP